MSSFGYPTFIIQKLNPDLKYELTDVSEPFSDPKRNYKFSPGRRSSLFFRPFCPFSVGVFHSDRCRIVPSRTEQIFAPLFYSDSLLFRKSPTGTASYYPNPCLFLFYSAVCVLNPVLTELLRSRKFNAQIFIGLFPADLGNFWLFTRDTNAYFIAFLSVIFFIRFDYRIQPS